MSTYSYTKYSLQSTACMWCAFKVAGTAEVIKSNCMIFGEKVGLSAVDANLNFGGSHSFPTSPT